MKKDKEFKAVNRDTSYVKDKSPDMKLGQHEEFTTAPKQSTQQKNHRTRHPTAENSYTPSITDNGNSAEYGNENPKIEPVQSDSHSDNSSTAVDTDKQKHTDLQEQPQYSEPAVNSENAFVTDMPAVHDTPESPAHRQKRTYSEHTRLGQKSVDYDFTKEHHSDFSFTDNAENMQSEHSEPIYNEPNEDITDDTPLNYERHDTAEQPKKSNSSYRRHSRLHTPKSTDYNISQTSKSDEYNFNTEKSSDITFERTEHKTNKQTSNRSKTHGNFNTDNKTDKFDKADKAETHTEPVTETDSDYDIGEAVKNSDTVFDRAADTGEKSEKSEKSELKPNQKKNKRLREKRRLRTEKNTSSDNSGKSDNAGGSASKQSKSSQKSDHSHSSKKAEQTEGGTKDYQFKRAEKAEFKAERARAKADKAEWININKVDRQTRVSVKFS